MTSAEHIIGREILRLDAEREREGHRMGKLWRRDTETRRKALEWALHVLLTSDPTQPPGEAVDAFLDVLKGSHGGAV